MFPLICASISLLFSVAVLIYTKTKHKKIHKRFEGLMLDIKMSAENACPMCGGTGLVDLKSVPERYKNHCR